MTEMIERMAACLWESGANIAPRSWELLHSDRKDDYRARVRTLFVKMREPNVYMLDAGLKHTTDNPIEVWRAMIDAAIDDRDAEA